MPCRWRSRTVRIMRAFIRAVFIALFLLCMTACSDDVEDDASATNSGLQVSTPDGQVSLSRSGDLPPGWPADFPLPSDSKPAGSGSLGGNQQTGMVALYTVKMQPEEAFEYYTTSSRVEHTNERQAGAGTSFAGSIEMTSPYRAVVTVAGSDDNSVIAVRMVDAKASTTTVPAG
jgi:hypothetical protein